MTRLVTPRPWPVNTIPKPAQLAGWLLACTDEERLDWCEWAQPTIERAHLCDSRQHEQRLEEMAAEIVRREELRLAYRAAVVRRAARIEDLEEALRRVACILANDHRHEVTDRDAAVLAIATDALDLDDPHPLCSCAPSVHDAVTS